MKCGYCKFWKTGIPVGMCCHPYASRLILTSNKMVFEDSSEECPKVNSKNRGVPEEFDVKYEYSGDIFKEIEGKGGE